MNLKKYLSPDSYLKLTQSQTQLEELIKNLEGKLKNIDSIKLRLMNNLKTRRDLIIKVNLIYKERISKINESQDNIKITFMASGNKEKFVEDMNNLAIGETNRLSPLAQSAIGNLSGAMDTAGTIAQA